ncbi:MAG: glycerate kinase [Sphaerochaetaceae bacterium]|nr:glycerate kinase [Sphaerochaetaceae bacterium]
MQSVREDADYIIAEALKASLPDTAVKKALKEIPESNGKTVLIAVGKAAWQMAQAAWDELGNDISCGAVVTKYGHSKGKIGNLEIYEAGHPVSDDNTYIATSRCLELVSDLKKQDRVLFLLSGGGSALFEVPRVSPEENQSITKQLLASGADIVEINTIRKRLSKVKGGRFALLCKPAHVFTIVLSDIIGDPLDMIASGPAYPDSSTTQQALKIADKYNLILSEEAVKLLKEDTPKELDNVTTYVTGSVKQLCVSASESAEKLGYSPMFLTACLSCEAREAGSMLASIAKDHFYSNKSLAFIMGGETVVHLTGKGKGGRNQEIALSAAIGLNGLKNCAVFSVGSDGTDGPTDAAGGYIDSNTFENLKEKGIDISAVLKDNDAYNALKQSNGLIITGPTGTNVNDLSVLLIKK